MTVNFVCYDWSNSFLSEFNMKLKTGNLKPGFPLRCTL